MNYWNHVSKIKCAFTLQFIERVSDWSHGIYIFAKKIQLCSRVVTPAISKIFDKCGLTSNRVLIESNVEFHRVITGRISAFPHKSFICSATLVDRELIFQSVLHFERELLHTFLKFTWPRGVTILA